MPDRVYSYCAVSCASLPLLRPPRSCPRSRPRSHPRAHLRYRSHFRPLSHPWVCVCVCVFLTFTDRASTLPSNIRSWQSGSTWSTGLDRKRSEEHLQSSNESMATETKHNINDKKKGITQSTLSCQKKVQEGHSIERVKCTACVCVCVSECDVHINRSGLDHTQ